MEFNRSCIALTILSAFLFLGLTFAPGMFAATFGVDPTVEAAVMARRAAILFVGIGGLAYSVRTLPAGAMRNSVARAVVAMMSGLVILGLVELWHGRVGIGIFVAIIPELVFALVFARFVKATGAP